MIFRSMKNFVQGNQCEVYANSTKSVDGKFRGDVGLVGNSSRFYNPPFGERHTIPSEMLQTFCEGSNRFNSEC